MKNYLIKRLISLFSFFLFLVSIVCAQTKVVEEPEFSPPPFFIELNPTFEKFYLEINEPKRNQFKSSSEFEHAYQKYGEQYKSLDIKEKKYYDSLNSYLKTYFIDWLNEFHRWEKDHNVWRKTNLDWQRKTKYKSMITYFTSTKSCTYTSKSSENNESGFFSIEDKIATDVSNQICTKIDSLLYDIELFEMEYISATYLFPNTSLAKTLLDEKIYNTNQNRFDVVKSVTDKVLTALKAMDNIISESEAKFPETKFKKDFDYRIANKLILSSNKKCSLIGLILYKVINK